MHSLPFLLILSNALLSSAKGKYRLNDGETVLLDPSEVHGTRPYAEGSQPLGRLSARDIFARQYCSAPGENIICGPGCCPNNNLCCENTSCIDVTTRTCCKGGKQCFLGDECCIDGCCPSGSSCVQNLDTGAIGCRGAGSSGGGSGGGSSAPPPPVTTTPPPIPTTTTTPPAPSTTSFTCENSAYEPCADQKFCCPYGDYCFYDRAGNPKCWDGSYYVWYYYFYWYYEEYTTTLWFTTSTSIYLSEYSYDSTVFSLPSSPSTPSIPPPTRLAVVPPSDTSDLNISGPTASSGPNAAGDLPNGGVDNNSPTIPSATLLATYTGPGGGAAPTALTSASNAVETLPATGSGAESTSAGSASAATRNISRSFRMEVILGLMGIVGVFFGAVFL